MQFEKGIPKITKKNGKRYIYVVTTLPSINSSGEHEESVELFELSEEPKKIYERSYEAWMQLLNRLTVGKGYYYQDNEGVDHPISKKVYHLIEKNCNQRLDEIKKRLI